MDYLVVAWKCKDGKAETHTWSFDELDEAKDFADWKTSNLKKRGYEYDVAIYERTNY